MMLPDLGLGLVCLPGLEAIVEAVAPGCNVIEVEPQPYWLATGSDGEAGRGGYLLNRAPLERIRDLGRPCLVHSVGYPVGGAAAGDCRQIATLRETLACLRPVWWSEHMSLIAAGSGPERRHLGFLLPPLQSPESVSVIVERIKSLQDTFGLPFAFETGVNYLRPGADEIPDGAFWGEIAERADCGILLDLHNVWCNDRNGRQPVEAIIEALPRDRVWETHLAAGQQHSGYWLDAHCGLPSAELLELARKVVPRLPSLKAMILEIIPDYLVVNDLTAEDFLGCLGVMAQIWRRRASAASASPCSADPGPPGKRVASSLPSPAKWEEMLACAVDLRHAHASGPLADDPGVEIYRELIGMVRRGIVVDTLPLSARYLLLALGEARLDALMADFWRSKGAQPFMSEEARQFAAFTAPLRLLPHLDELMAFELAAHRAAITQRSQFVRFTCAPEPLLRALKAGAVPTEMPPALVEVEVYPATMEAVA